MGGAEAWPWLALAALGAFHGINPAMGWLFAVALGMHRRSRATVGLALVPIVLGHALSIAVVLAVLLMLGTLLEARMLYSLAGTALIGWGTYHFFRGHRHRFRFSLTTGLAGLGLWSFLMATAHGAGLMLAPIVLQGPVIEHSLHAGHSHHLGVTSSLSMALAAVLTHTAAMAATTAVVAIVVYEWLGLALLRRGWFNIDWVWAGALVAAGVLILVL